MSNLDIENFMKGMAPDIEMEPSEKKFMERYLEEAFQPENLEKISQRNIISITIENFKCIGKAVTIPIRPITLLFGKNSVGKSTVLQALSYHYQIWAAQDEIETPFFNPFLRTFLGIKMSGGYTIDFRDFPSLVHCHELDRKIRIHVEYDNINFIDTQNQIPRFSSWQEVVTDWEKGPPYGVSLLFGIRLNGEEMLHFRWKKEESPDDMVAGSNGEKLVRLKEKEEDFPENFPFKIYVNTNTNYQIWINSYLNIFRKFSHNSQESASGVGDSPIRHLGPFREVPPDDYKIPPQGESRWEKGFGAWDTLAQDPEVVKKTNHYIQNILNLGYSINRRAHNATDPEQWPRLHDENNNIDVRLSDIGVGIAQIIPVVVGALESSYKLFAVEQPELHVHPAIQVVLGDVFIDSIKNSDHPTAQEAYERYYSRIENCKQEVLGSIKNINDPAIEAVLDIIIRMIKDQDPLDVEVSLDEIISMIKDQDSLDVEFKDLFKIKETYDHSIHVATKELARESIDSIADSNRTMLIETHSEHLLLRLLRRVRETTEGKQTDHTLTPDDLSVVYVRPTSAGVKFTSISITDDGDFYAPWPEGFFDERVRELF